MTITRQEEVQFKSNPFATPALSPTVSITDAPVKPNPIRPNFITRESNLDVSNLQNVNVPAKVEHLAAPSDQDLADAVEQEKEIMTIHNPPKNLWRVIAVCLWVASAGFSDAAPGALLPSMESHYNISYSVVSLIWMSSAVGFVLVACFSHKIVPWFGTRWAVTYGICLSVIGYSCIASGGPFPLVCVGFFAIGIGLALVLAQSNIFLSKLENPSKYLAFFHGSYGAGATISPLAATSMLNRGLKWNYVFIILLGLMIVNAVNANLAFKGSDVDLKPWDYDEEAERLVESPKEERDIELELALRWARRPSEVQVAPVGQSEMKLALKNSSTWLIALFVICYQGAEVSIGGWIVTYLLDYRGVGTSYGYVLSGFWAGLTIGRLALTRPLHKTLGSRKSITLLAFLAIGMIVLSWVVPSGIAVGVFVGFGGLFIGPTFPLLITIVSSIVPRKIQVVSLTIMSAFGSIGGALFPFITGLLAQSQGAYVVLPIFIASYSLMLVFWFLLPNVERKPDKPEDGKLKRFLHRVW